MLTKITYTYIACDGEVFDDDAKCKEHEDAEFNKWIELDLLDMEDFIAFLRDDNTAVNVVTSDQSSRHLALSMLREFWEHQQYTDNIKGTDKDIELT